MSIAWIVLSVVVAILIVALVWVLAKGRAERRLWDKKIRALEQASVGLANDVAERLQAEGEIRRQNAELEARVRERTERLQFMTKELETFSYSVSHDLRAPLRRIGGFVGILLRNHAPSLESECKRLLGVISHETECMGHLIDDLLAFFRIDRQHLQADRIDMTELAYGVFQDLVETAPERSGWLKLAPLPQASGDRAMLRQVFANLFRNAIKFTAKQPDPAIEVSGWTDGGNHTYCIKDNGVGFDPRYTDKLFGLFQRLHRQDEFTGTGIGLAIVQRIVQRHAGKVWAEGSLGTGAAFYFNLPAKAK